VSGGRDRNFGQKWSPWHLLGAEAKEPRRQADVCGVGSMGLVPLHPTLSVCLSAPGWLDSYMMWMDGFAFRQWNWLDDAE